MRPIQSRSIVLATYVDSSAWLIVTRDSNDVIFQDTNSHFDDELSDLTSLSSSVLEFEYENGRRYCSTSLVSILAQPLPLILGLAHQLIHK